MKNINLKSLALTALMSAVICICGPISIVLPISPVPISLGSFAVYLIVIILGTKLGTFSILLYILIGLVGAPVFTGFSGGVSKVLGPTGGYIIGYIFLSIIMGTILNLLKENKCKYVISMLFGTIVLYIFGTIWLKLQLNMTFAKAFFVGVVPFIIGDIIKMIVAVILGEKIKNVLIKAKLLYGV